MNEGVAFVLTVIIVIGLHFGWGYLGYRISRGVDKYLTVISVVICSYFGTTCTLQVIVNLFKAYGG